MGGDLRSARSAPHDQDILNRQRSRSRPGGTRSARSRVFPRICPRRSDGPTSARPRIPRINPAMYPAAWSDRSPQGQSEAGQPRNPPRGEPPDKGKNEGHPHLRRDPRSLRGFKEFDRGSREPGQRSAERRPVRTRRRAAAARSRRAARARSTPEPRLDPCGSWSRRSPRPAVPRRSADTPSRLVLSAPGRRSCSAWRVPRGRTRTPDQQLSCTRVRECRLSTGVNTQALSGAGRYLPGGSDRDG